MLQLPNGCTCSDPAVTPKNWNKAGASTAKTWLIHYRFYDADGNTRQCPVRGMNHLKVLAERQNLTKFLLDNEIALLYSGYNPITGLTVEPAPTDTGDYVIHPNATFNSALDKALSLMEALPDTIKNTTTVVKYVKKAATDIGQGYRPLSEISRRHILMILKQCEKNRPDKWSNNQFNVYRSNLMILYDVMLQYEAVASNFLRDIKKKKKVKKTKRLLTLDERKAIAAYLPDKHPVFWNYVQLFFHSGGRTKELMRLRVHDVELSQQRYKTVIWKRANDPEEIWRPIKDIAVPFWEFALQGAKPGDLLFSRGFRPGTEPGDKDFASQTWRRLVKKDLGIPVDFYKLKHQNLDEIAAILDIKQAQKMAEHTTPVITMKEYAIGEADRQAERLKKVSNPFV